MSDQPARDRIAVALDATLLVEAGAGSGKTTALIARLLTHIRRGTPLEAIAAVTFTRKAANELRERFQNDLEATARELPEGEERLRVLSALADLDRGFIGTIHAFCARLLRDRPIEAGLDPTFRELDEEEWPALTEAAWREWLDGCRARDDAGLRDLQRLGIDPRQLAASFQVMVGNPDVEFAAPPRDLPDHAACRARLERLLESAEAVMPHEEPEKGWDDLQARIRLLQFLRGASDWSLPAAFFRALAALTGGNRKIIQNRWSGDRAGKAAAKKLSEDVEAFVAGEGASLIDAWREHRYRPVRDFLARAAEAFEDRRLRSGQLGFQDLLTRTAKLLRDHPPARAALGARYRYLLVDEFQDTDPLQAEVCFLLASDAGEGCDWRRVTPRPGALFVVGDPKQSIYRFRRADIQTYEAVKRRIAECGEVLRLTRNFRSTTAIGDFVNRHFGQVFPTEATAVQAAFSPLECQDTPRPDEGIHRLPCLAANNKTDIPRVDAAAIASWIATQVAAGVPASDFMVITYQTHGIAEIARALAARNIPARTTGASLPQETELRELVLVLRALADPENPVLVAAALEGIFFGLTPADLYEARREGLPFALSHPPAGEGAVRDALAVLHGWWQLARQHPPDVLLDRLTVETGLLAWSASQPLGEARAGALLRLGDVLRHDARAAVFDLPSAIERLEGLLNRATDDAPLRPGFGNAVQVLNLHKAKGLEAEVVLLANPVAPPRFAPTLHVRRGEDGRAIGGMLVMDEDDEILAQPMEWTAQAETEEQFLTAERERLLYVAATRAKRMLVVSQYGGQEEPADPATFDRSGWSPFQPSLASEPALEVTATPAIGQQRLEQSAEELEAEVEAADAWRRLAGEPGWRRSVVTRSAREEALELRFDESRAAPTEPGGRAWGRAVHRVLEAAGRGRMGERLRAFTRAVARSEQLAEAEAERLHAVVAAFLASPTWQAVGERSAHFEYPVMWLEAGPSGPVLREGIVDALVIGEADSWVVDWKTGGPDVTENPVYRRQVDAYAAIVSAMTGRPARGEIIRVPSRS